MSMVLKPVTAAEETNNSSSDTLKTSLLVHKRKTKHGIKCKENCFKHKCNKALKNKLKKYKLRKDGKEDPEVLNVSHTFHCSLRIKSPNNNNIEELNIYDIEERPKNYLFKMGRRKKDVENVKTVKTLFKDILRDKPPENPGNNVETEFSGALCPNSQERKHTNAFKLMMDSRNKSIGGNSPGKEKTFNEDELQLIKEEKLNKAKRNLVLQKMAEAKGSLKKKEKEELLEETIRKKMEKRAQRLTTMLVNNGSNKQIQANKDKSKYTDKEQPMKLVSQTDNKVENKKIVVNDTRSLNLINMFHDSDKIVSNKKQVPKEDLDFLEKLSPSIRKKENMLCYFKKVEKHEEDSISSAEIEDDIQNSPIIKVKIVGKNKKNLKKKLSLKTEKIFDLKDEEKFSEIEKQGEDNTHSRSDTRKRKRGQEESNKIISESNDQPSNQPPLELNETNSGRPKRQIKKPIQYKDDFVLSSSDEDYNIITPKKKKQIDKKKYTPEITKDEKPSVSKSTHKLTKDNVKESKKATNNNDLKRKNNIKLAPIFTSKPILDPVALEAKQKFLQSGVPEKLKKIACQQKQIEAESSSFPKVVHVQQDVPNTNWCIQSFKNLIDLDSETSITPKSTEIAYNKLLSPEKPAKDKQIAKPGCNVRKILQNIKLSYPKFPVYRTYHLLKAKSKGEFGDSYFPELDNSLEIMHSIGDLSKHQVDKLNWTDKYKPMSTNQIIGNFETTKELKKWLETWSLDATRKMNDKGDSDSSDFCYSDTDSRDSVKTIDNLLILTGPTGSGKTACVYAVASELAIKVIEVNASSKRNGKIMIQDLQEATQSHKVNRAKGSSTENSQKSQDLTEVNLTITAQKKGRKGRPKKLKNGAMIKLNKTEPLSQPTNSQENVRTGMSLILIDDADIVFDQDDGFCSAINQLVQSSKRPVILITSSLDCTHLQRFLQSGKIMKMKPLLPRMLGTWLDIMCLADSATCWPGLGAILLDLFKGDIRKTINCLQFYASTHKHQDAQEIENFPPSSNGLHDEHSSMSWADSENHEEYQSVCSKTTWHEVDTVWKCFMEQQILLLNTTFPTDLCGVWWNLPTFLNIVSDRVEESDNSVDKQKQISELDEMANVLENISAADCLSCLRPDARRNICSKPWYSSELDSSSECENFRSYSKSFDINDDITKALVVRSICNAQKNLKCNNELYVRPTSMTVQRERDRVVSRHDAISANLNPAAVLDRRGLALDYWSSCRTICRFEKVKTDTNSKRNNRFCHYLRSLKMMCKNDVFDRIGESLNVQDNV